MSKDIEISKFDTEQGYDIEDVSVFDVSVEVNSSNNLLVTNSNGDQRTAGRWKGEVGTQTENIVISNDGNLIQSLNNQHPDISYVDIRRDQTIQVIGTGAGLYNPSLSSQSNRLDRYIDENGEKYTYILPDTLVWNENHLGALSAISTYGVRVSASSIWGTAYSVAGSFDRSLSTYHLWGTTNSGPRTATIEYPFTVEASHFLFGNARSDYAITAFKLEASLDGVSWNEIFNTDAVTPLLGTRLYSFTSVESLRFLKITPTSTINVGAFRTLELLIKKDINNISIDITAGHMMPVVDPRYFTLEEDEDNFVLSKRPDSEIDTIVASPYTNGLLKWENYCRFEDRLPITASGSSAGVQIRQLNTVTTNNLGIAAPLPTMILPAGVYFVNALSNSHRTNYHTLLLTKSDGQILLNGSLSYSGNSTGSTSTTRSTIRSILILEEETPVQLREYRQVAFSGFGNGISTTINADNIDNTFAVLELWKIRDIEDIENPSAGDPNWDKVILLLNGEGGWADQSKYQAPVMNIGAVPVVDANYGRGYDIGAGGVRYLYTLPNDRYTLGTDDFTLECWIKVDNTHSDNRVILSNSNHSTLGSWAIYRQANGLLIAQFRHHVTSGSMLILTGPQIVLGDWYHIAIVRESDEFAMYINGLRLTTGSLSTSLAGDRIQIGKSTNTSATFPGVISNIRITRGVNRYSGLDLRYDIANERYTVDTDGVDSPTSLDAQDQYFNNVILLGEANGDFTDSSVFGFKETVSGLITLLNDPTIGDVYDFTANNANRLSYSIPFSLGTSDFTIECWYKRKDLSSNYYHLFGNAYTTSTFTAFVDRSRLTIYWLGTLIISYVIPNILSWNHIAVTRSRGVYYVFINGVLVNSSSIRTDNLTTAGDWWIGSSNTVSTYQGNHLIGSPRLTLGVARYKSRFLPITTTYTKDSVDIVESDSEIFYRSLGSDPRHPTGGTDTIAALPNDGTSVTISLQSATKLGNRITFTPTGNASVMGTSGYTITMPSGISSITVVSNPGNAQISFGDDWVAVAYNGIIMVAGNTIIIDVIY